jgi:hypothetical protein
VVLGHKRGWIAFGTTRNADTGKSGFAYMNKYPVAEHNPLLGINLCQITTDSRMP